MTNLPMTSTNSHSDGTLTSLAQLFSQTINDTQVRAIEIPLFQRDYAQGRHSEQARHIRERFISDLCSALDGTKDVHLDFVFGDVLDGTLFPLDGQQRLTTLFLLHCYLAWHLPELNTVPQPWHAFHYATRPGARAFCQFLTRCRPETNAQMLSDWMRDQADYLPTWKHDPTVQGMLVVLDEIHKHFQGLSTELLRGAWQRLTDPDKPAISFLLLPVVTQALDSTLYVKMNSRGRPLTEFENFKAELESLLRRNPAIDRTEVDEFSRKIDTQWAKLFWEYRGENHLIDDQFMRYLRFLFEVQVWKQGGAVDLKLGNQNALTELSVQLLDCSAANARSVFDWIIEALDVWLLLQIGEVCGVKAIKLMFSQLFTRPTKDHTKALRIFNFRDFDEDSIGVDMFHACCVLYGTGKWGLAHTLMLYGVLQACRDGTPLHDLLPRLRLLRNLIEASEDEIRAGERNKMPALLGEVEKIMADGSLTDVHTFNQVQVANERVKQLFVAAHPALQEVLHRLEDHALLRGGLTAFDLDPAQSATTFEGRAEQFLNLFSAPYSLVTAALLAKGNNGRPGYKRLSGHRLAYLGAPKQQSPWEDHWRARKGEIPHPSADALMTLLDDMAAGMSPQEVVDLFLGAPTTPKDWRYYMVKHEEMRSGDSGCHVIAPNPGYSLCMLKGDSCDNRSYHYDAYLLSLATHLQLTSVQIANLGWPRCFPGYEREIRNLELRISGIKIQCVEAGWQFSDIPENTQQRLKFQDIVQRHPLYQNQVFLYAVPQNNGVDTEDRIELFAPLLRELVIAGL